MSNRKPTTTNKYDSAIKTFPFAEDAGRRQHINIQNMQNVLLIWLDSNIDETNDDCQNTIKQLRRAIKDIKTFTDGDQCLEFVQTIINKKACMVISGSLGEHIVPRVHNMSQIDSIFIFCNNQNHHEQWATDWSKIKGVFTDIISICEALKKAAHQCEQNAITMSFVGTNKKLDQLDPSFMYTHIIKEILLSIKFEQKHIQDYNNYCRDVFVDDEEEMVHIKQFEDEYHDEPPIFWYSCDMFLYPMINRALRLLDGDIITRMGFFIGDLHRNIEQLHKEQYAGKTAADTFTLYRGQGLSKKDFEQLMKTKGGLVSFNYFLSTSENIEVSLDFAQKATKNPDQVGVLFIIQVNPAQSTTPFASIASISAMTEENEVLFSMHSVFRIQNIKQMEANNSLYEVNLTLTSDNDPELNKLTDYIRQHTYPDHDGWYRLGFVLSTMGQYDKAETIFQILLDQKEDDEHKASIYRQLGIIKASQGKHLEALTFYEQELDINQKTLPSNHPRLANLYCNIGNVHARMGNYLTALSFHEKAVEIRQESPSVSDPDLAGSYSNIGNVHNSMGDYPKALLSYTKALEISQESLPSNHPNLAATYNNIGIVHGKMGNYPEALSSFEKALDIRQQSLPSNHPDLAGPYDNIGNVHANMGNYPKALSFHEKALDIRQESLPPNHPDLAATYRNIGIAHDRMGNYPEALSSFEKALDIRQQSLPSNHLGLAGSYNDIGNVHANMGNYPKGLSSNEKALEILQQSLPSNHPDLASSYYNIGNMYAKMGNYPEALSFHEKALEIRQQSLPPSHPHLAYSYGDIGNVYRSMGNYPKGLSSNEKALEILQQSLPSNHPDLGQAFNNIGEVHNGMGNYSEALSLHEKALDIRQQSLPPNHPDVAESYNSIGNVHRNMSNYSKACTFYEHAIQIGEQLLPSSHPDLQKYRNNLEDDKNK
ncbi:unnamed protein product [Adineta steineri]|uniref:Uncharacterized protein n=2 Tax=Adineta steineri TaxID=433720 RepID=A0A814L7F6_9BILA|nr:unnamed protein product [Adineta steineri]